MTNPTSGKQFKTCSGDDFPLGDMFPSRARVTSFAKRKRQLSANTTLTVRDARVRGDATSGAITFTLPSLSAAFRHSCGQELGVRKTDSSGNAVTVEGAKATSSAASISTTTLTVGGTVVGTWTVGMLVTGGTVSAGTKITGYLTGRGGAGTYTVNNSQTVTSSALTGQETINGGTSVSVALSAQNSCVELSAWKDTWDIDSQI